MIRHNLSPASAPWARDVESRIDKLERTLGVRQGARRGDVRKSVMEQRSQPQVFVQPLDLAAPTERMVATWRVPVPEGAKSAWVSGLFVSEYQVVDGAATNGRWLFFTEPHDVNIETLYDPANAPRLLLDLDLWEPLVPPNWEVLQTSFPGSFVDVIGKDSFPISAWSVLPMAPTNSVILQVNLIYTVFWSFEGVSQWGT